MNIQMLPQLCVHLIGSFIEDEIEKQKKVVRAEYMLDRAIEMCGEMKDYADTEKLTKKELTIIGNAVNWGALGNYDASTFKRLKEIITDYYNSRCVLKNIFKKNPDKILKAGHNDSVLRHTYLRYSAYEFVKAQRMPVTKPKRTPIQLKNKDGSVVNAWLIE